MKLLKFDEIQFHPIKNHLKHLKITVSGKQNQQRFFISFFPFQIHQFFLQIHKQIRNQFIAIDVVVGVKRHSNRNRPVKLSHNNNVYNKSQRIFFPQNLCDLKICIVVFFFSHIFSSRIFSFKKFQERYGKETFQANILSKLNSHSLSSKSYIHHTI